MDVSTKASIFMTVYLLMAFFCHGLMWTFDNWDEIFKKNKTDDEKIVYGVLGMYLSICLFFVAAIAIFRFFG